MTLAEKLTEVGNNRPKLYKQGALDYSPQETVSGEAIGITDISPIEHNMGVKVRGKNLFNTNAITTKTETTIEVDGVSYEVYDINGYTNDYLYTTNSSFRFDVYMKKGKTYTVSLIWMGSSDEKNRTGSLYMPFRDVKGGNQCFDNMGAGSDVLNAFGVFGTSKNPLTKITFRITPTEDIVKGALCYYSYGVKGYVLKDSIQIEEGTTATSYAPYIEDISTVKLYKGGKNLLPFPYESKTQTKNGIEFTVNEDGTINVNGTATANTTFVLKQNILLKKGITYTISGCPSGGSTSTYVLYIQDMGYHPGKADAGKGCTFTAEYEKYYMWITINNGATVDNLVFKPLLSTDNGVFEPYIEPTIYDVPTDGIVEGVKSLYPSTTLYTDTSGAVIDCTYYQDGRKVKENLTEAIINLGGEI